jgi:hypothetical protein
MAKLPFSLLVSSALGLLAAGASANATPRASGEPASAVRLVEPSAGPLCDGTKKPESPPPPKEPKS